MTTTAVECRRITHRGDEKKGLGRKLHRTFLVNWTTRLTIKYYELINFEILWKLWKLFQPSSRSEASYNSANFNSILLCFSHPTLSISSQQSTLLAWYDNGRRERERWEAEMKFSWYCTDDDDWHLFPLPSPPQFHLLFISMMSDHPHTFHYLLIEFEFSFSSFLILHNSIQLNLLLSQNSTVVLLPPERETREFLSPALKLFT